MHILYQIQETAISLNLCGISVSTQTCPWEKNFYFYPEKKKNMKLLKSCMCAQAKPFSFMGLPMPTKAQEPQVRKIWDLRLSVVTPFFLLQICTQKQPNLILKTAECAA